LAGNVHPSIKQAVIELAGIAVIGSGIWSLVNGNQYVGIGEIAVGQRLLISPWKPLEPPWRRRGPGL
jgi:hypothetical protein